MSQKGVESQLGMPPRFPPSFNFFFQSLSVLGKNWMESLKSLPSPLESSQFSPLPQSFLSLANLSFASQLDQSFHSLLRLSSDSSNDSKENSMAYQLRNRHIPMLGDINHKMNGLRLNPTPSSIGKGRGIQSNLSKVRSRAILHMETRIQLSITRALRAMKPLTGVPE